jgi:hypothetical protein
MNLRQRIVAFVGLLVIAGMLLYPPWIMPGWRDDTYRFIFSPPQEIAPRYADIHVVGDYNVFRHGELDTQRLGVQCVIVAIITGAMILLLGTRKPHGSD